ncbi:hypothetical protein RCL1_005087 [Eukaryota sp. TZLM3-RCL]
MLSLESFDDSYKTTIDLHFYLHKGGNNFFSADVDLFYDGTASLTVPSITSLLLELFQTELSPRDYKLPATTTLSVTFKSGTSFRVVTNDTLQRWVGEQGEESVSFSPVKSRVLRIPAL